MKRGPYILLLSIATQLVLVTATPVITLQHEQILQGETLLATITVNGSFTEQINSNQLLFLQGRKEVFVESKITEYNNVHYVYAYMRKPGNYTLQIKNILYKDTGNLKGTTIQKEIIVAPQSPQEQILAVQPGFIRSVDPPTITLVNRGDIPINLTYEGQEISIEPAKSTKLSINVSSGLSFATIQTDKEFKIPLINEEITVVTPPQLSKLIIYPRTVTINTSKGVSTEYTFFLENRGETPITIQTYIFNTSLFSMEENISTLPPGEIRNNTLYVQSDTAQYFSEEIWIIYQTGNTNETIRIPIDLFIVSKETNVSSFNISSQTCSEKEGIVCEYEQTCSGQGEFTRGGEYCCIAGECTTVEPVIQESKTPWGFMMGIGIFGMLIAIGYWIYKKSKRVVPKKPKEQLKETGERYNKRITGSIKRS